MSKSRIAGRRALAALVSSTLLATGTIAVTTPVAMAQASAASENLPTKSVTGAEPAGQLTGAGKGEFQLNAGQVERGGLVTVKGSGLEDRDEYGYLTFKLNDGANNTADNLRFPSTANGGQDGSDVDEAAADWVKINTPDTLKDGNFSATVRIPDNLENGWYWIRILGGQDENAQLSKYVWFEVVDEVKEETETTEAPTPAAAAKVEATVASGNAFRVSATGFKADEDVTASVDDKRVKFAVGRRDSAETVKADENGAVKGTLRVPAGTALAGQKVEVKLESASASGTATVEGIPGFSAGRNKPVGGKLDIDISNLPEGAKLVSLKSKEQELATDELRALTVADNKLALKDVALPTDSSHVGSELVAVLKIGDNNVTYQTGLTLTPGVDRFGEDAYDIARQQVKPGLYQSAYSEKENVLYVTRAVGRPPIKDSGLAKYNADTLELIKEVTPANVVEGDDTKGVYAVYGVGLDEEKGYVWTTNSRQAAVALYDTDLNLIKQWPARVSNHPRDIAVDPANHRAYVSTPRSGKGTLEVFEADKETPREINLAEHGFNDSMSIDIDPTTGDIYTVSMTSNKIAKINDRGEKPVVTVWEIEGAELGAGSGIAYDPLNKRVWAVGQGTSNAVAIDATQPAGKATALANVPTGSGALNIEYSAEDQVLYVTNFGADTISVLDANTYEHVANLWAGGNTPNHVTKGKGGNVYVVTKGNVSEDQNKPANLLVKIDKKGVAATPETPSSAPQTPSAAPSTTPVPSTPQTPSAAPSTPAAPSATPTTPADGSTATKPNDKGEGSSQKSVKSVLTGLALSTGIIGALAAVVGLLVNSNIIPAHLFPEPLRKLLGHR